MSTVIARGGCVRVAVTRITRTTSDRRRRVVVVEAKKKRRGGGSNERGGTEYADDFALYGSFDESYADGAGLLLGKREFGTTSGRRGRDGGGGYDAVVGVLDALSEVRNERRNRRDVGGRSTRAYEDEAYEDEEYADDEYADDEETSADAVETPKPRRATPPTPAPAPRNVRRPVEAPKPRPKPQVVVKPQKQANAAATDPSSTKAKALQTLCKWGFATSDAETAIEATSDANGDAATAKKRQIAALDWLLANAPMDAVPEEYKIEAQRARA